jgi:O-glycosyl hydrolase
MSNEHRVKIQNSNILNALIEHAEGTREMGATQVTAALGLLRKALPDLSATTVAGDEEGGPVKLEISWQRKA